MGWSKAIQHYSGGWQGNVRRFPFSSVVVDGAFSSSVAGSVVFLALVAVWRPLPLFTARVATYMRRVGASPTRPSPYLLLGSLLPLCVLLVLFLTYASNKKAL